jgi:hypothetical protein
MFCYAGNSDYFQKVILPRTILRKGLRRWLHKKVLPLASRQRIDSPQKAYGLPSKL